MKRFLLFGSLLLSGVFSLSGNLSAQYCPSAAVYGGDEDISNVTFADINNSSTTFCNTYTDYTSVVGNVVPGTAYPITVNTVDCEGSFFYDRYVKVYIDFNQNFSFDDPGEMVWESAVGAAADPVIFNGNITIDPSAVPGLTRMRVICIEGDPSWITYGACDDPANFIEYYYGETEDYTLMINGSDCVSPVVAGTANASAGSICPNTNVFLSLSGNSIGVGLSYQWQSSLNGFTWTDITGATSAVYNANINTPTSFRCQVTCVNGPSTDISSPVFVDMNSFLACYCVSEAQYLGDEMISNVTLNDLNNNSTGCATYTDFTTSPAANLFQSVAYPMSVTATDCEGSFFYERSAKAYIDYNHDGQFSDPAELVLIQSALPAELSNVATSTVIVPVTAQMGITRMRVIVEETPDAVNITPCGTYFYGETEDYLVNIMPQPANEAGILSIDTPMVAQCSPATKIKITVKNNGTASLNTLTINSSVNSIPLPVVNWSGNIAPGATQSILVQNYLFVDGDSLFVQVSNPNGQADPFTANDTKAGRYYTSMNGVYTVYGTNPDFATIDDVIAALTQRGVCDTAIFKIRSGTYTGNWAMGQYPGAGSSKRVIFTSETGLATDVTLTTATGPLFTLSNADGYVFEKLRLINTGASNCQLFLINGGSENVTIKDNIIRADSSDFTWTTDFTKVLIYSPDGKDDNLRILNNNMNGATSGIILFGSTNGQEYETGLEISGNKISGFRAWGAASIYAESPLMKNNIVSDLPGSPSTFAVGLDLEFNINGGEISSNRVALSNPASGGIQFYNARGGVNQRALIANNFVTLTDTTGNSNGIFVTQPNGFLIDVYHNSVASYAAGGAAINVDDGSGINIKNNIAASFKGAPAMRIAKSYSLNSSDNNDLFSTGNTLAIYTNTNAANLAAWQTASSQDAASLNVNPAYISALNLHTCSAALNDAGTPVGITTDIDGDVRSTTTPDIGADEFLGSAAGLLTQNAVLKCPAESVNLGNSSVNGVTYSWTPGGATTSSISATNAGTYVVTATSNCGNFSDTVVVTNKPLPTASFSVGTIVSLAVIFNNTSTNATGYLWNFGDGTTSTETNPTHLYTSGDTYAVTLTAYGECDTVVSDLTAVTVKATGIENLNQGESVSIFPNPSNGIFNLNSVLNQEGNASIGIFDMNGKLIHNENLGKIGKENTRTVQLSVAPGVYTLRLTSGDRMITRKLVIK